MERLATSHNTGPNKRQIAAPQRSVAPKTLTCHAAGTPSAGEYTSGAGIGFWCLSSAARQPRLTLRFKSPSINAEVHAGWCPSGTSNPVGLPLVDRSVRFRHTSANSSRAGFRGEGLRPTMSSRKRKPFQRTKEVKRQARLRVGSPPPAQPHQDRRKKLPKHRKREWRAQVESP